MSEASVVKRAFLPLILIVLSYEWLVSGLNKIISGEFSTNLRAEWTQAIPDMQYSFYASILKTFEHQAGLIGWFVLIGELTVGVCFLLLAISMIRDRHSSFLLKSGIIAAIGSAFMNINFFFYQGGSVFIHPSEPFDEGIPLDFIMFLLEVGVLMVCLMLLRLKQTEYKAVSSTKTK